MIIVGRLGFLLYRIEIRCQGREGVNLKENKSSNPLLCDYKRWVWGKWLLTIFFHKHPFYELLSSFTFLPVGAVLNELCLGDSEQKL